jgi:DNA replication protein DnaC
MLTEPTLEKLHAMRLRVMAETWQQQQRDPKMTKVSFEERFAYIVDAEHLARKNRALDRRMKAAKLRNSQACIEGLEYSSKRNLDRAAIRQLSTCRWIEEHLHVIIQGATGVGKTYVACALANQACRQGYRTVYRRVPRLFDELLLARADGSLPQLLSKYSRVDLLVLDDWGIAPLRDEHRLGMLEILDDRDGLKSTIVTAQLPPEKWHDQIGDPTVAEAILDRLVHRAHILKLKGPSRRPLKGKEMKW